VDFRKDRTGSGEEEEDCTEKDDDYNEKQEKVGGQMKLYRTITPVDSFV
jgi:hypothetical protein